MSWVRINKNTYIYIYMKERARKPFDVLQHFLVKVE